MTSRVWPLQALCAVALTCSVASVRAEPSADPVLFESTVCPLAQAELLRLLELELAPRRLLDATDPDAAGVQTRARLACDDTQARLSLQTARHSHEVQLDFATIGVSARPRLVAISLAELLATVDMEEGQASSPAPTEQVPTPDPGRAVWLAAGLARTGDPRLLAPVLQTGLVWRLPALPLALQGELFASWGERELPVGRVASRALGGSLALGYTPHLTHVVLLLGAGVKVGQAQLTGRPSTRADGALGRSVSGVFWGPVLSASAAFPVRGHWAVRAGLELAYLVQQVEGLASGASLFSYGSLQVHATLGLPYRF